MKFFVSGLQKRKVLVSMKLCGLWRPEGQLWQECDEGSQPPVQPASTPKSFGPASATGNSTALAATGKAPAGALWPEAYGNQTTWKVPPTSPPKTLQQAGASSDW